MKAIALISGGLDSILAAKLIRAQGLEVFPVHFKMPFCQNDPERTGLAKKRRFVRENLGTELTIVDISNDYLELIRNPHYGFGSNMNPCIDCKILMLKKAKEMLGDLGASFVITGEVLGQRPMSQYRNAMDLIERRTGLEHLLLRPLSAKLFAATIPEQEKWVNREALLAISGRSRKEQLGLARNLEIKDYTTPAGGCLLTDPRFSQRLKDLLANDELSLENIDLLKTGRHFRIDAKVKLVVGRNELENKQLETLARQGDYIFYPPQELPGPTSLGRGIFSQKAIELACAITCRYSDLGTLPEAEMVYQKLTQQEKFSFKASPASEEQIQRFRI